MALAGELNRKSDTVNAHQTVAVAVLAVDAIDRAYHLLNRLAGKLVTNQNLPDQILLRVFGPDEKPSSREPLSWTLISHEAHSDDAFETMTLHINSRQDRQRIDELRIGTTWSAAVLVK